MSKQWFLAGTVMPSFSTFFGGGGITYLLIFFMLHRSTEGQKFTADSLLTCKMINYRNNSQPLREISVIFMGYLKM